MAQVQLGSALDADREAWEQQRMQHVDAMFQHLSRRLRLSLGFEWPSRHDKAPTSAAGLFGR